MPNPHSSFIAFSDIDDDTTITVKANDEGPQIIGVDFHLPDFSRLPGLYLTAMKARELREALAEVLDGIEETS